MQEKTIKAQSAKKNFIFQILYQIIIFVIPLITAPYLTRTLGDTALGIYSYTNSIAYYFVLVAMLGISRHGQRTIAARKKDHISLRKTFWSLYFVHSVVSFFSIGAYLIFAFIGGNDYRTVYLIQTIYVASALFDITWLFYGLENFRSVVIKNLIIKVLECICIFCFVNATGDLWIYTLIMSSSMCLGQAVMLPQASAYVKPIKFGWDDVKEHFKPLLVLFIAVISSTLYTVFNKTLLGIMSTEENVAYYEYSNKIINIPKSILGVIFTVLFPRACSCMAKGDEDGVKKYLGYSLHFTCFLGIGAMFGLIGIANLFSVLYYGEDFAACGNIIIALSPVIYINELGNIIRTQYMVPKHMDNLFILCLAINAVINIVLSVVLIPIIGVYGVIFGTLMAELFGTFFQLVVGRKYMPFKKVILTTIPYLFFGAAMFGVIYLIRMYFNDGWLDLLFQIAAGGGLYCILCAIYLFFFSPIKNNLRNILHIKKRQKVSVAESAVTDGEADSTKSELQEMGMDSTKSVKPDQSDEPPQNTQ